jgi:hypothetical protein
MGQSTERVNILMYLWLTSWKMDAAGVAALLPLLLSILLLLLYPLLRMMTCHCWLILMSEVYKMGIL